MLWTCHNVHRDQDAVYAFLRELVHFVDCVRNDRPPGLTLRDATEATCIGIALRTIQYGEADVMLAGGAEATIRGTPATVAVSTDIWAEATIGNFPPGT